MLRRRASKLISGGAGYFCVTLCSLSCLQCALSLPLCYLMRPAGGKYIFSFWQNFSARAVSCCFSVFFAAPLPQRSFTLFLFFLFLFFCSVSLQAFYKQKAHGHVHAHTHTCMHAFADAGCLVVFCFVPFRSAHCTLSWLFLESLPEPNGVKCQYAWRVQGEI